MRSVEVNMWKVINGNNIDILKEYPDNHFDAIVTDPPYGIEFLGKDWDKNTGAMETWQESFRVLKPGGHMLAFSAARTYHHLATNVEMAGFEIRDQLMWLYGSGFPKAQDIGKAIQKRQGVEETRTRDSLNAFTKKSDIPSEDRKVKVGNVTKDDYEKEIVETVCTSPEAKQWAGWKTALKPAHEPIVMARKPFSGSCVDNVIKNGLGALNIDASRIPATDKARFPQGEYTTDTTVGSIRSETRTADENPDARFPSNVLGEIPEYQKYFYCPKVSRAERQIGFDVKTKNTRPQGEAFGDSNLLDENKSGNNHPTVKPVELMKYLIKLVTPAGGKVLDPFNGSGSTGMAAVELGYDYVGCELDPDYVEIANKRISAWEKRFDTPAHNLFDVDE